jgi:hypothetical protein
MDCEKIISRWNDASYRWSAVSTSGQGTPAAAAEVKLFLLLLLVF